MLHEAATKAKAGIRGLEHTCVAIPAKAGIQGNCSVACPRIKCGGNEPHPIEPIERMPAVGFQGLRGNWTKVAFRNMWGRYSFSMPENAAQRGVSAVGQPIEPPTKLKLVASMEVAEALTLRTRACCFAH
jgi:hypothetical protein